MSDNQKGHGGGAAGESATSDKPYRPGGAGAPGTEGGADPAGMAPKKDAEDVERAIMPGPHAGSGA